MNTRLRSNLLPVLGAFLVFVGGPGTVTPGRAQNGSGGKSPGAISGSVYAPGSGPTVANLIVTIVELDNVTQTDKSGAFSLPNILPGTYTVTVTGTGYAKLRIEEVHVEPGETTKLNPQVLQPATTDGKVNPEVVVSAAANGTTTLATYVVTDDNIRGDAFATANVDVPRTVNDVQPYTFVTSEQMEDQGATNIEQYLQRNLTQNTSSKPNSQGWADTFGEFSAINLRGVGTNETLILIDGRVAPSAQQFNTPTQPDVNGIPIDAVDHIEILPLSASAIYGGSAVGGVINIVLKKDYAGGSILYTFGDTMTPSVKSNSLDATYGFAALNDKLHVMVSAHFSDGNPLTLGERSVIHDREVYLAQVDPTLFPYGYLGASTPNVTLYPYADTVQGPGGGLATNASTTTLTFKGSGASLGSNHFYVPAGVGNAGVTAAQAMATAGQYNYTQSNSDNEYGANNYAQYGAREKDFTATARYDIFPNLQAFTEFAYEGNIGIEKYDDNIDVIVPSTSPYNPFQENIIVTEAPPPGAWNGEADVNASNERNITFGLKGKLPGNWNSELDYTWSQTNAIDRYVYTDSSLLANDLVNGTAAFNPLSDNSITLAARGSLDRYEAPFIGNSPSNSNELALRFSGPVPLPFGFPDFTVTAGVDHQIVGNPNAVDYQSYPAANTFYNDSYQEELFGQLQDADAIYVEADDLTVISPKMKIPLVSKLSFQVAARQEWYEQRLSQDYVYAYTYEPAFTFAFPALVNGQVVAPRTVDSYQDLIPTAGLKWEITPDLYIRPSYSGGFVIPTYTEINPSTTQSIAPTLIVDPTLNKTYNVQTVTGGNPNLVPQKSQSWDYGLVYEPKRGPLQGLRVDWEYWSIKQLDYIQAPTAQEVANNPGGIFNNRITRDPTSGLITKLNLTYDNANEYFTDGWDGTVDYRLKTAGIGTFELSGSITVTEHDKRSLTPGANAGEFVGWANSGGEAKTKETATLTWDYKNWTAGWTTRFYDSYNQFGVLGDPELYYPGSIYYTLYPSGYNFYAIAGKTIPSQMYHDVFVKYAFGRRPRTALPASANSLLAGVDITLGVKDLFNSVPPLDPYTEPMATNTASGDLLLRNFFVSVRKNF